jgi:hypothetical protein
MADTALKGAAHFRSFGPVYPVMQVALAAALAAAVIRNRRFHATFVIAALAIEAWWILRHFGLLGG